MAKADIVTGLKTYLLSIDELTNLVDDRIFGEELPEGEATAQPRRCITIKEAGGFGNRGTADLDNARLDVRCYGPTPYDARVVYLTVYTPLKEMAPHIEHEVGIKILSVYEEIGPFSMRDPDTRSPFVLSQWITLARESVIAS